MCVRLPSPLPRARPGHQGGKVRARLPYATTYFLPIVFKMEKMKLFLLFNKTKVNSYVHNLITFIPAEPNQNCFNQNLNRLLEFKFPFF